MLKSYGSVFEGTCSECNFTRERHDYILLLVLCQQFNEPTNFIVDKAEESEAIPTVLIPIHTVSKPEFQF